MGGRLIAATLLLGITLLLVGDANLESFTPRLLLTLTVATYCASLGFAVWLLKAPGRVVALAHVQLAWDVVFATTLIYASGGVASAFTFLYGIAILAAALIVGPRATRATAMSGLVAYTLVGLTLATGWLPPPPDQPTGRYLLEGGELVFPFFSNVVGLLLVTLLATNLAERLRQTGGALQRATENVASLTRLNDDIVRSLASGLLTTDLEGKVLTINQAGAEMFGASETQLLGLSLTQLLPAHDPSGVGRGEGNGMRPAGDTFPVGYSATPLIGARGEVIGRLLSFQDLTEIQRLRDAAERAERLAALGRLATGLAHEIRNPLSSISGAVELVREAQALEDEDRRLLGIVLGEVERLNDLVTTMLQVGRPRDPSVAKVELDRLVRDVVAVAKTAAETMGGVDVVTDLTPVSARVDADQMRQVVWNLLKNAIQASPKGGRITVTTAAHEVAGAAIEVRDEGTGIAPSDMERLFDTFYSSRPHGVGLGLALVRQIVDAHRGSIVVESAPGEGATFRVVVPSA